jgi:hypothetical protein
MGADHRPQAAGGGHLRARSWWGRSCPRCGSTSRACEDPEPLIFAPKGACPRALSKIHAALQGFIALERGTVMGAKGRSSSPAISTLSAKAMPPLWQYFSGLSERQTSPSLPPKGADRGPPGLFPCKPAFSRDVRRGHHRHLGPLAC